MSNRYGELIILSADDFPTGGDVFRRDVTSSEGHTHYIQEFSNLYNLGYDFKESDYQTAPCELALSGHLVIKTVDEVKMIGVYIPEVVSDKQYEFLYDNQEMFQKSVQVGANSLRNGEFIEINGFDNIMREINKKNLLYSKQNNQRKGV